MGQALCFLAWRQQFLVDVRQVGVGHDGVRIKTPPIFQEDAAGSGVAHIDLGYVRVESKFHARLLGDSKQGLDYLMHAALGVPDAMGQLGVGHHREGGRRLEGAESHVDVLEGEGRL